MEPTQYQQAVQTAVCIIGIAALIGFFDLLASWPKSDKD